MLEDEEEDPSWDSGRGADGAAVGVPPLDRASTFTLSEGELAARGPDLVRLTPGSLFAGRYVVGEALGSGGFAVVYRAQDRLLRREVALKVLRSDRANERSLRRFLREAALARDVASPHLVRIFDVGESAGATFLVLELLPGGTLRDRIERGPLPPVEAVAIARQVLDGLATLHARGIVHRDVKPANVLFDADGTAKLADFGLATWHEGDATRSVVLDGAVIGTLDYVAPEQAVGAPLDPRSDLFSFGVVLFEALTGKLPFRATSSVSMVLARLAKPAPPLRAVVPGVPRWLGAVVDRLLERRPEDRYATAAAVAADLAARRAPRRTRQRRRLAAVAALAVVAAAAGGTWRYERTRFARLEAVGEREGVTVRALARNGDELWRRSGADAFGPHFAAIARVDGSGTRRIVTVARRPDDLSPEAATALTVLDPQTGKTVARFDTFMTNRFPADPAPERWTPWAIDAVDLDGDGTDEVFATFAKVASWPSYTVLLEPRLGRVRSVLEAPGYQVFAGTTDLDGDGSRDLLFTGYNSVLGRYGTVTALRLVVPANGDPERSGDAVGQRTEAPGLGTLEPTRAAARQFGLLWSRLLPRGGTAEEKKSLSIDLARRRIRLTYRDRPEIELTYSGGSPDDPVDATTAAELRYAALHEMEEARRLAAGHAYESALAAVERARSAAQRVADPVLDEAAGRIAGEILVAAGRTTEAELLFAELARRPDAASEVAFTAATSYHLAGDLERAVAWYRRGVADGGDYRAGSRSRYYYLEGVVLALGELGRWDEAVAAIDRHVRQFPNDVAWCQALAGWVGVVRGEPTAVPPALPAYAFESARLAVLETRARREPAAVLLPVVRAGIPEVGEARGALRSLEAMLLAATGDRDGALREAALGVEELARLASTSVVARGLLPLARTRLAALEAGTPAPLFPPAAPGAAAKETRP